MTTKAQRDEWRGLLGCPEGTGVPWGPQVVALLDENERLREALRVIGRARDEQQRSGFSTSETLALYVAIDDARTLLEE